MVACGDGCRECRAARSLHAEHIGRCSEMPGKRPRAKPEKLTYTRVHLKGTDVKDVELPPVTRDELGRLFEIIELDEAVLREHVDFLRAELKDEAHDSLPD